MYAGWHQVAFERALEKEVTAAAIGSHSLVLVRRDDDVQAFDATCPHRGAHLGHGGRLDDDAIVCPFHGHRIVLGDKPDCFSVSARRTLASAGLVFVLLDERHENGLRAFMDELEASHWSVPGFSFHAPIAPRWVIENVFDAGHFHAVHEIDRRPEMTVDHSSTGHLVVRAEFETPGANAWQEQGDGGGAVRTRFVAHVFSPTLVATELGPPERPHVVVTAATPDAQGGCEVRVSLMVPPAADGSAPDPEESLALMRDSRTAFEQDMAIWAHLDTEAPNRFCAGDEPVLEYRLFCERFEL